MVASGLALNLDRYRQHIDFIRFGSADGRATDFYFTTPATLPGYLAISQQYFRVVARSLGAPFSLLFLAGLVFSWKQDRRAIGLALLGALTWAAIVLPVRFLQARFALITVYLFALAAGYGAAAGLAAPARRVRVAAGALFAAGIIWSGLNAADLTQQMLNDGRYALVEQMQPYLRPGDRLATPNLDGPWNFPRFGGEVIFTTLPRQGFIVSKLPDTERPEFILIITTQEGRQQGEQYLDPALYETLVGGKMGYRVLFDQSAPHWFARPLFSSVNPRVVALMRDDLADAR